MRYATTTRSIVLALPEGLIEPNYAPDGLDESAIDSLIEQAYAEVSDAPLPTSSLSTGLAEERRIRRRVRQVVRSLPGAIASHGAPVAPTAGEAA